LNGLIEQWGIVDNPSTTYTINNLLFTTTRYQIIFKTTAVDATERQFRLMSANDKTNNSYKFTMYVGSQTSSASFSWFATGY
jgi:hypothetical protein